MAEQAPKTKGVTPGKTTVIKMADPALIAQWRKPQPAGQLEVAAQQFQGDTPTQVKAQKGVQRPKPKEESKEDQLAQPKVLVPKTPDLKERPRPLDAATLELLPSELKAYQVDQADIESHNPYLTDTTIYTPQSRKSFYRFITSNYSEAFRLAHAERGKAIDEFACKKLEAAEGKQVE